jgi:hypothetical protein
MAMATYVDAHSFPVGQWLFFPEAMVAVNMHNGTRAVFGRTDAGGWFVACINCPADWMMRELIQWFAKWINNRTAE